MVKIANREARQYVRTQSPFKGNNLHGESMSVNGTFLYVVYSYGYWPLFVYVGPLGRWYENEERYSVTTSKHRSQSHPYGDTVMVSKQALCELVARGSEALPEIEALMKVSP
jgi:hypothetical protein